MHSRITIQSWRIVRHSRNMIQFRRIDCPPTKVTPCETSALFLTSLDSSASVFNTTTDEPSHISLSPPTKNRKEKQNKWMSKQVGVKEDENIWATNWEQYGVSAIFLHILAVRQHGDICCLFPDKLIFLRGIDLFTHILSQQFGVN